MYSFKVCLRNTVTEPDCYYAYYSNLHIYVLHEGRVYMYNCHILRLPSFTGCLQKRESKATQLTVYGF